MKSVKVLTFKGLDGAELDTKDVPGMRALFCGCLTKLQVPTHESVAVLSLGQKVHRAEGGLLELEDAEFDLLMKAVEQNKPAYPALLISQMYLALKGAEKGAKDAASEV